MIKCTCFVTGTFLGTVGRLFSILMFKAIMSITDHNRSSFVTEDASKGLDRFTNQFDLVHCRCVAGHVRASCAHNTCKTLNPNVI